MRNILHRNEHVRKLLITVLGTAIGVGLTFTVNRCVDSHNQQAAQRETAIMAVCDIDEIVQGLQEEIHQEDSLFKVTMYVASHQELIDNMSLDTLNMAFVYLYDNPMTFKGWTADTKENAFNSGIDARMNIGNNQFYDNVQSCYYLRRALKQVMEEAPVFRRPISKEEYEGFLQKLGPDDIDYDGIPSPTAKRDAMKKFVAQGATTLYIKRYFSRRQSYNQVINELERLNRENKLLMAITDEDVETYIRRNTSNVSEQDPAGLMVGTWDLNLNDIRNTYVFYKNKSGNTMVWTKEETTPAGKKQITSTQLYRKQQD